MLGSVRGARGNSRPYREGPFASHLVACSRPGRGRCSPLPTTASAPLLRTGAAWPMPLVGPDKEAAMPDFGRRDFVVVSATLAAARPAGGASAQPQSLGAVAFPTSARSPEAQARFERGVAALHSFWYP